MLGLVNLVSESGLEPSMLIVLGDCNIHAGVREDKPPQDLMISLSLSQVINEPMHQGGNTCWMSFSALIRMSC